MRTPILLVIVTLIGNLSLSARDYIEDTIIIDDSDYVLFIPSHELQMKVNNGLKIRYLLIKLRVHPELNLDSVELDIYSRLIDTIQTHDNASFIDSNSIILKNGLTWNLNEGPPAAPKFFYIKAMTKKGRKDSSVMDRLNYLQFCHRWKELDELPNEMVEKFVVYGRIEIDKVVYFESLYEFRFNVDKRFSISKKEININRDLLMHNR